MAAYNLTNQQVANLLHRVSAAYEVLGENRFRIAAYDRAAVSIEHSTSEIKDIWDDNKLNDVPGIGSAIAGHLDELFKKGKVKHFEQLFSKLPPSMFVFLEIPGVGAKTAYSLAKELKIKEEKNALEKLKKALKAGKLRSVENFGEKSEEKILKGIASLKKGETKKNRMLLPYADNLAQEIIAYLKESPFVLEADPLGSLRRMVSTIGDIDISVSTNNPSKVLEYFFAYPKIKSVLGKGEEALGRVILFSGQQVDLRLSRPEDYGAMLQYFTGSKMHNILLREYALKRNWSLSEYGIKSGNKLDRENVRVKNKGNKPKLFHFASEEDFYHFIGLDWIPPELREGNEEIQAAVDKKLPDLIKLSDIKGDLHLHSNFSIEPSHDLGEANASQMVKQAYKMGYSYLGFSEHNPSVSRHNSKQIINLLKRKNDYIEKLKYSFNKGTNKLPIDILNGLEIDIQTDGKLAIPDKGFDYLDYAIASVHTSMDMSRSKMTERIINALKHPKVKIFGHPTGRMLNRREGYEIDWDKLFDFCLQNNKILEISSWPERLDLPDMLVKQAVKMGVLLVINSDSHAIEHMELMKYGVSVARRGWASKKNISNALPFTQLGDILLK